MLTKSQMDRKFAQRVLKDAAALTPAHAAAEAGMDADGAECPDEAERRRERVQHLADPDDGYLHEGPEVDKVDLGELEKRYNQAFDGPVPGEYPPLRPVRAEEFRRGPVAGQAALSPGYDPPGRAVPVPSATLSAGAITRPLITDGRSRPCAPEAC